MIIIIIIIRLSPWAGKMNQILRCDWLPERPLGTTSRVQHEEFPRKPYNKSFIDQACSVKVARYWPRSFFACLWTWTPSRFINMQKRNLANIQPSWPHTWSRTQIYSSQHWCTVHVHVCVFKEWNQLSFTTMAKPNTWVDASWKP